ncbi:hypothetical protein KO481_41085 [Nocardia sp. NEAU-G5]|uniref:Uncharacterized protein n=1 Tax=Nocardia albiluteola TaxID=2842303 RepID=A0ABS6BC79_9NOCA|nr:hypothetical protein [Nocardia albiluteola]MBU3067895.1 hypothetical protein [Nocardia albiluteola]
MHDIGIWIGDAWDWLHHVRADAWAASAGWATAVIALGTVIVAGRYAKKQVDAAMEQAAEARKTREEQAQPNVIMYSEPNQTHWHVLELVVKNFGTTPAYNIRLNFEQAPQVSPSMEPGATVTELWHPDVIPILAPWQEWRVLWDSAIRRFKTDLPLRYEGFVTYEDKGGKPFETKSILDWGILENANKVVTNTMHDLVAEAKQSSKHLASINESLQKFGSEDYGLWTYIADAQEESIRRHNEALERRRQIDELRRQLVPHEFETSTGSPATAQPANGETEPSAKEPE